MQRKEENRGGGKSWSGPCRNASREMKIPHANAVTVAPGVFSPDRFHKNSQKKKKVPETHHQLSFVPFCSSAAMFSTSHHGSSGV